MLDIAIINGTLITENDIFAADIGIEGDRIAVVAPTGGLPPARHAINASNLLVMPGAIDIHFHVRAPANPERGTFETETRAAAAGGVTTILEMPISTPCCATHAVFEQRRMLGAASSYVNFGLYGAPGLLDRDQILAMAEAGACGFKIFTHAAPPERLSEFAGLCLPDEADLYVALELVRETGLLTSVHAEHERMIALFDRRTRGLGGKGAQSYIDSRPPVVEALAVAELAVFCEELRTRIHLAHVSSQPALQILAAAQARQLPMTGETCPHYLLCSEADMLTHGPFAMIKPPLRTVADQEALWDGLRQGVLLAITTDHSPFTLAEKERGLADIWSSAIGAPGVEALVPMIMTEALNGRISLSQAIRFLCSAPARLFNLDGERGTLTPGSSADIVLYDPQPTDPIDSTKWQTKARAIERLYHQRACRGAVHTTIVNGVIVYRERQIRADAGVGRFVRPVLND